MKRPSISICSLAVAGSVAINGVAIAMVRVWNPSREAQPIGEERRAAQGETIWGAEHDAALTAYTAAEHGPVSLADVRPARTRRVWDNPVLWREIRTWAYGRKMLIIRLVYLLLFAMAAGGLYWMLESGRPLDRAGGAMALVPLFLLSLFLVNAQAVTSLTSERDARALDLLLVTDLTPKEIVFGKLGGVFYNTKEMILLPMLLCVYLGWRGTIGLENLFYLRGRAGRAVRLRRRAWASTPGMNYVNSRSAVATSLGTVFFLFVGVATCMRMMVAFSGSFQAQLQPFLAFMVGGGIGLYVALGARNPSTAIGVASFLCPFATFYAITSFLLNYTLAVFLVTIARLRLHDRGHARAGHLRVRRGHRPNDDRRLVVGCRLSVVSCQLSVVGFVLSAVGFPLSSFHQGAVGRWIASHRPRRGHSRSRRRGSRRRGPGETWWECSASRAIRSNAVWVAKSRSA